MKSLLLSAVVLALAPAAFAADAPSLQGQINMNIMSTKTTADNIFKQALATPDLPAAQKTQVMNLQKQVDSFLGGIHVTVPNVPTLPTFTIPSL